MVDRQLRGRDIRDERVLAATMEIPRELFVPLEARACCYGDWPLQIGHGQTISQPYMTALMAEALELTGDETVLEIGAGSGYAAAVLGALAAHVVAVEIVPALADLARENLRRTGHDRNVTVICADGSTGFAEMAPYDAISVAAGAPEIPAALVEQLRDPGRLVIPVGRWGEQELRVLFKDGGKVSERVVTGCQFVPLRGADGWQ